MVNEQQKNEVMDELEIIYNQLFRLLLPDIEVIQIKSTHEQGNEKCKQDGEEETENKRPEKES